MKMKLKEFVSEFGDYEIKDVEKLKSLLEKPKPKSVWDLKPYDKYYRISSEGIIYCGAWFDDRFDCERRLQGNAFLTKEETEFEKRRREVFSIVKKHSYEFSREDWENGEINKWHPYYNHELKRICCENNQYFNYPVLHFKSINDVEEAIKEVSEADFIKYYLGVKDYVDQESK